MAGRRRRIKSKDDVVPEAVLYDAETLRSWNELVVLLRKALRLPDINSRHGLKKIHAKFDQVFRALDVTYQQNTGRPKIIGAIGIILATMAADSVLRDRMLREGSLLPKLHHLFDMQETRKLAVDLLCRISLNANEETCGKIVIETLRYLRLSEEHLQDPKLCESILVLMDTVLFKATGPLLPDAPMGASTGLPTQDIDMLAFLQFAISVLQKADKMRCLLDTFFRLSATAASCWNARLGISSPS